MFTINHTDENGSETFYEATQVTNVYDDSKGPAGIHWLDKGGTMHLISRENTPPRGPGDPPTPYRGRVYVMNELGKAIATYLL